MTETGSERQHDRDQALRTREDLDRKIFYLRTLLDTSTELAGIVQPQKMLDTFLLMTMGPLGITTGLAGLVNVRLGSGHITSRGLEPADLETVRVNIPAICLRYFTEAGTAENLTSRTRTIAREGLGVTGLFPSPVQTLFLWDLSGEYAGFLALGEKLTNRPLDDGDEELLLNLIQILKGAMNHALSVLNIQQLNAELLKKNQELEEAMGELNASREELDRRVFHLKTLSDLSSELSPLLDMDRLLRTFLMISMGALGVGQGFVIVQDRKARKVRSSAVGPVHEPVLDGHGCEQLIYQAFDACEIKSLAPGTVSRMGELSFLRQHGIEIDVELAFFFVIDASFMGVFALGPNILASLYSREEVELIVTQISSFMVYLQNARAFETIGALNEDLTRRNEELRQTIADLTEARHRITLLERARAHLRSLVQQEVERVGRPGLLDCALILLLATAIGVLFNLAAPQGIPLVPETLLRQRSATVNPQSAMRLAEEGVAVLVDARPKELYDQKHIRGAVNIPISLFDIMYMMKLSQVDSESPIVVYGRHVSRRYDEELAFRLKQRDHENVRILEGGLQAWEAEGYPVQ